MRQKISIAIKEKFLRGFTLIELMVVLIIIGILAAVVAPRVHNAGRQNMSIKAAAFMIASHIRLAQKLAIAEHRQYKIKFYLDNDAVNKNAYEVYYEDPGPIKVYAKDPLRPTQDLIVDFKNTSRYKGNFSLIIEKGGFGGSGQNEIVFNTLGGPTCGGYLSITDKNAENGFKIYVLAESGVVNLEYSDAAAPWGWANLNANGKFLNSGQDWSLVRYPLGCTPVVIETGGPNNSNVAYFNHITSSWPVYDEWNAVGQDVRTYGYNFEAGKTYTVSFDYRTNAISLDNSYLFRFGLADPGTTSHSSSVVTFSPGEVSNDNQWHTITKTFTLDQGYIDRINSGYEPMFTLFYEYQEFGELRVANLSVQPQ